MIEATQSVAADEVRVITSRYDAPEFLISWSSRWEEFITSIRPALGRSPKRLAGEAPTKIFPLRGMIAAWILESALLTAAIVIPRKIASLQPYVRPTMPKYDVLYFSGTELPQTEDIAGSEKGRSGSSGGRHAEHRTQNIRVVRGDSPAEKVVDAPKINLPQSDLPVANLLAIRGVPGPPPTSDLKSSLPTLPQADPVAPAPEVSRNRLYAPAVLQGSIVAPPPEVERDKVQALPQMATSVVAPPPEVSRDKMRAIQGITSSVVAPTPEVVRDRMRAVEGTNTSVIAPPPSIEQAIAGSRLPGSTKADVVPPPVSAPVSPDHVASRLSVPQQIIVAPPPSNVSRELSSYGTGKVGELHKQIVPPAVEIRGAVTGNRDPNAAAQPVNVVPPPANIAANGSLAPRGSRGEATSLAANVVPPPPSIGSRSPAVTARMGYGAGLTSGPDLTGTAAAPAKASGGTGAANTAVVVSSQPGSRVGVPGSAGSGAIAVAPGAGSKSGIGGSGTGSGLGHGNGPGSGLSAEGSGAASAGSGHGSDPSSKNGISPYPGKGGAGTTLAKISPTPTPGISVNGGNTITLPSFGGGQSTSETADPSRARMRKGSPEITIVASSRSGGAFNFYGALKGDRVYTIYFNTIAGTTVLQFADPTSTHHVYAQELSAPEPLRTDLPASLSPARMVIACILDQTGVLRNVRVLEGGAAPMSAKVLASLPNWKFKPAFRGDQPVEVNAILGFNIDTR